MTEDTMELEETRYFNDRRVRKAPSPTGTEIPAVMPDAKRQMVTASPSSTIMEVSTLLPSSIPSADDVLVHVSSYRFCCRCMVYKLGSSVVRRH